MCRSSQQPVQCLPIRIGRQSLLYSSIPQGVMGYLASSCARFIPALVIACACPLSSSAGDPSYTSRDRTKHDAGPAHGCGCAASAPQSPCGYRPAFGVAVLDGQPARTPLGHSESIMQNTHGSVVPQDALCSATSLRIQNFLLGRLWKTSAIHGRMEL